jgi:spectinomycin phosphotransferase
MRAAVNGWRSGPGLVMLAAVHPRLVDHPGLREAVSGMVEHVEDDSLYRWAPVFRCSVVGRPAVLKQTARPLSAAEAVARWTRGLAAAGVPVVSPLVGPVAVMDDLWVVYPWVEGRPYDGRPADVEAAGDLLGRLHAAGRAPAGLPDFGWPDHDEASVAEDVDALAEALGPDAAGLQALVRRFMADVLPRIRDAGLPLADASMDYKANNLVMTSDGAVLVDPDDGERLPRLLDLALAVLLFHSEHDPAPPRPFDVGEWRTFRNAWARHVHPTPDELRLWPLALEYMLSEWVVWQIVDSDTLVDDSPDPRQAALLRALARLDVAAYPLASSTARISG